MHSDSFLELNLSCRRNRTVLNNPNFIKLNYCNTAVTVMF